MRIHIYYRHYNVSGTEPRRPEWFTYERCYENLLQSLSETDEDLYRLNIIYDGQPGNWIENCKYHKLHSITAGNDLKSFQETCRIIKEDASIEAGDLIYFLENDYMHVKGWAQKVFELFTMYTDIGYVSLYDHMDKYSHPMYSELVSFIFLTESHHWRTTPSTCGSFIINTDLFLADLDVLSTVEGDHHKFLWLAENRNRTVITPIPGLSTHCMKHLLSPTINWNTL